VKKDELEAKRKAKNDEIIERMRAGESLSSFDKTESWFPNRGIIKKDKDAIAKLYGENKKPTE
jgi:hypothetical protein